MFSCCKRLKQVHKSPIVGKDDCIDKELPISQDDYTFSGCNQTLIKSPNSIPTGYPILVLDSNNSNFYILDASVQVTLENLENCNVILGPTESSVFIRNCKNTSVSVYCQQFRYGKYSLQIRVRDCNDLTVFLYSSTDPIIESSKNIKFRPNTLSYSGLESQLLTTGLKDKPNKWNLIYDFNDSWPKNYSTSTEIMSIDTSLLLEFSITT